MRKAKHTLRGKQAKPAEEGQDNRLRKSLGVAPVTIVHRDSQLRITWSYNAQQDQPIAGLLGCLPEETYLDEQAAALRTFYEPVLTHGETAHTVIELTRRKDNKARQLELFAQPLRDKSGNICGISCTAYDVTQIAATKRQLSARKTQLRLALNAASMGDWQYDVSTEQLHYSNSYARLYGLPEQQGPSTYDVFSQRLSKADLELTRAAFVEAVSKRENKVIREFSIMWPDGTQRWISSRGQVQYEGDKPVRIIGIDMDITKEKRTQQLLEQANNDLEQFAFAASHDLKEPVRTISSLASLLERHLKTNLDHTTQRYIDQIHRGTKQMERLIMGLLEFAQSAYADLEWEEVDLQEMLLEVLELLESSITETDSNITYDALPKVRCNRLMLSNTLQNLISNAIKFRHEHKPPRVHVSAQYHGEQWLISIKDNGLGIAEGLHQQIFQPFHRSKRDQDRPGSGLGLALCKRVIERHGGRIWVESKPRGGSTFYFTLPVGEKAADLSRQRKQ